MKLVLFDPDSAYAVRLRQAFLHRPQPVDVLYFTSLEDATMRLRKEKPDAVLLAEALRPQFLQLLPEPSMPVFLLSDAKEDGQKMGFVIFRYQKPECLYREISERLLRKERQGTLSERAKESVFAYEAERQMHSVPFLWVSAAAGGVGATSIACACAICAARQGKAVFYLSLDGRTDPQRLFGGRCESSMSEVIYRLKRGVAEEENIAVLFGEGRDGVYYFGRCRNFLDATELQPQDIHTLFQALSDSSQVDAVVLDYTRHDGTLVSFFEEERDRILFVSDGKETTDEALDAVWRDLSAVWHGTTENRGLLLYNRCSDRGGRTRAIPVPVVGCVPNAGETVSLRRLSQTVAVEEVVTRWLCER